jgi:hypothetical protein
MAPAPAKSGPNSVFALTFEEAGSLKSCSSVNDVQNGLPLLQEHKVNSQFLIENDLFRCANCKVHGEFSVYLTSLTRGGDVF